MRRFLLAVLVLAMLAGCASAPPPLADGASSELRACAVLFERVDALVSEHGVRDASAPRVPGVPYLRVDRLLASYRDALAEPAALAFWLSQLAGLDREARDFELANLPRAALAGLDAARRPLGERLDRCREALVAADREDPARGAYIVANARVPDDYSIARRAFGLYPITSLVFAGGQERWQRETESTLRGPLAALPIRGTLQRYVPRTAEGAPETPLGMASDVDNPLALPRPDAASVERLAARHAPVFEVVTGSDDDRIGTPGFDPSGRPAVDPARPTVTVRVAATRAGQSALVQLVYTAWFAARPKGAWYDLLGGRIDGLVWRVTLAPDGTPLVYDTIHPCGCFHMFFPGPRADPAAAPPGRDEFAFVPHRVAPPAPGERIVLRIASATHYLENVRTEPIAGGGIGYALAGENTLRSMLRPDGSRGSLFGPDGRMAGTERLERFLFWPSGIVNTGAMRQWGRHATAFVGRRHFDDPRLIESRFILALPH